MSTKYEEVIENHRRLHAICGYTHDYSTEDIPSLSREVRVLTKTHYGTKHYYPSNRTATLFLKIQGGKTLSKNTLKLLIAEGFEVKFDHEEEVL
jgi:hypothetical protein